MIGSESPTLAIEGQRDSSVKAKKKTNKSESTPSSKEKKEKKSSSQDPNNSSNRKSKKSSDRQTSSDKIMEGQSNEGPTPSSPVVRKSKVNKESKKDSSEKRESSTKLKSPKSDSKKEKSSKSKKSSQYQSQESQSQKEDRQNNNNNSSDFGIESQSINESDSVVIKSKKSPKKDSSSSKKDKKVSDFIKSNNVQQNSSFLENIASSIGLRDAVQTESMHDPDTIRDLNDLVIDTKLKRIAPQNSIKYRTEKLGENEAKVEEDAGIGMNHLNQVIIENNNQNPQQQNFRNSAAQAVTGASQSQSRSFNSGKISYTNTNLQQTPYNIKNGPAAKQPQSQQQQNPKSDLSSSELSHPQTRSTPSVEVEQDFLNRIEGDANNKNPYRTRRRSADLEALLYSAGQEARIQEIKNIGQGAVRDLYNQQRYQESLNATVDGIQQQLDLVVNTKGGYGNPMGPINRQLDRPELGKYQSKFNLGQPTLSNLLPNQQNQVTGPMSMNLIPQGLNVQSKNQQQSGNNHNVQNEDSDNNQTDQEQSDRDPVTNAVNVAAQNIQAINAGVYQQMQAEMAEVQSKQDQLYGGSVSDKLGQPDINGIYPSQAQQKQLDSNIFVHYPPSAATSELRAQLDTLKKQGQISTDRVVGQLVEQLSSIAISNQNQYTSTGNYHSNPPGQVTASTLNDNPKLKSVYGSGGPGQITQYRANGNRITKDPKSPLHPLELYEKMDYLFTPEREKIINKCLEQEDNDHNLPAIVYGEQRDRKEIGTIAAKMDLKFSELPVAGDGVNYWQREMDRHVS